MGHETHSRLLVRTHTGALITTTLADIVQTETPFSTIGWDYWDADTENWYALRAIWPFPRGGR